MTAQSFQLQIPVGVSGAEYVLAIQLENCDSFQILAV